MTRALSNDLRDRVVAAFRAEGRCRSVAARFGVGVSSVVKWAQREAETGSAASGKTGGHRKRVLAAHHDWLMARMARAPEFTLHSRQAELAGIGAAVSHDTIWRYLRAAGFSFKKHRAG